VIEPLVISLIDPINTLLFDDNWVLPSRINLFLINQRTNDNLRPSYTRFEPLPPSKLPPFSRCTGSLAEAIAAS
jgi:hypothetical protein